MSDLIRPPTPQVLVHRLPSRPVSPETSKPAKYILVVAAPLSTPGKLSIANELSKIFSCPEYIGDSIHSSSAKAASVGAQPNKERYQRMWLSKMTRTGLLFPDESKPAAAEFSGFGGSASTSRRGSVSSVASNASSRPESVASRVFESVVATATNESRGVNAHFTISEEERRRRENPVLLVLTQPELEAWHRTAIQCAVGEYGIGVIFIQLYEEDECVNEELPILQPLNPGLMNRFPGLAGLQTRSRGWGTLHEEMKITVDKRESVAHQIVQIADEVRYIIGIED